MQKKAIKSPLMFVGTGSDVGKSVLAAGICRILLQDGYHPAPFKSQNMSLNSYVTSQGGEIGRAQAVQAEACQLECHTDMNPILLKPSSDKSSQVILNGKVYGNYSASSYFRGDIKDELLSEALKAFSRLAAQHNPVVIEGAGSISELNLRERDIANMQIALETKASTFLIADIERGGIFGSVYGSIALLSDEERARIKGIIINKFRGDISLFTDGAKKLEELTGKPVVGIIPYYQDISIEEEDSVSLAKKENQQDQSKINVAVVLLRRISNFTDFNRLEQDPRVNLFYTNNKHDIQNADIVILPGSKNTMADLSDLKNNGLAQEIARRAKLGKPVIGICGGYQMMGHEIKDPHGVEGNLKQIAGLGILPISTVMSKEKNTVQSQFLFKDTSEPCKGYEIHMGESIPLKGEFNLNTLGNGTKEGYQQSEYCWGTYMHGILDNASVINHLLLPFTNDAAPVEDYDDFKQRQYDLLANHLRKHMNMDLFYQLISHD